MPITRRKWRIPAVIFGLLLSLLAVDQTWVHLWRIIPVGYDTTRLTGPLGKEGQVDYLAAVDQMAARGVSKDDNAAPLLIEAAGPKNFYPGSPLAAKIMQRLGMKSFTARSPSLIGFPTWVQRHPMRGLPSRHQNWNAVAGFEARLGTRPWTAEEYPVAARWIAANRRALALLADAAKKPHLYLPLVSPGHLLVIALLPAERGMDSLCGVACADAMLSVGQRRISEALRRATEVFRLGALLAAQPDLISFLEGLGIEDRSLRLDRAIANSGRLSAIGLRLLRGKIQCLTPPPPLADVLNGLRLEALDEITQARREGLARWWFGPFQPARFSMLRVENTFVPVDYAGLLRRVNRLFDAEVAAARLRPFRLAEARLYALDGRWPGAKARAMPPIRLARPFFHPLAWVLDFSDPDGAAIAEIRESAITVRRITDLYLALTIYWARHGRYPGRLSHLSPQYLRRVPRNPFTDGPLHYAICSRGHGFSVSFAYVSRRHPDSVAPPGPVLVRVTIHGGNWPAKAAK